MRPSKLDGKSTCSERGLLAFRESLEDLIEGFYKFGGAISITWVNNYIKKRVYYWKIIDEIKKCLDLILP